MQWCGHLINAVRFGNGSAGILPAVRGHPVRLTLRFKGQRQPVVLVFASISDSPSAKALREPSL
jgi:hypothetical protein